MLCCDDVQPQIPVSCPYDISINWQTKPKAGEFLANYLSSSLMGITITTDLTSCNQHHFNRQSSLSSSLRRRFPQNTETQTFRRLHVHRTSSTNYVAWFVCAWVSFHGKTHNGAFNKSRMNHIYFHSRLINSIILESTLPRKVRSGPMDGLFVVWDQV